MTESSSTLLATLKFGPLLDQGVVRVDHDWLEFYHPRAPRKARRQFWAGLLLGVLMLEAILYLTEIRSTAGFHGGLARFAMILLLVGGLIPLCSPRHFVLTRQASHFEQDMVLAGSITFSHTNLDLNSYDTLIVESSSTWVNQLIGWWRREPQSRLVLSNSPSHRLLILAAGPRGSIVELARFIVVRHPNFHLRIEV